MDQRTKLKLVITMSHDKNVIYCAGVDPIIQTFSKVVVKCTGRAQWFEVSKDSFMCTMSKIVAGKILLYLES